MAAPRRSAKVPVSLSLSGRSVLVSCAIVAISARAHAEPSSLPERHDGFYLRLAGGFGSLDLERRTERISGRATLSYAGDASSVSGGAALAEVSVGGSVSPHLVLAGTWLGWLMPGAALTVGGGSHYGLSTLTVTLLAPTADVFPNPLGGFHFGGGAGVALARVPIDDPPLQTIGGLGVGFTAHLGYDAWTSDEWSAGLFARATFAAIGRTQAADGVAGSEHDTLTSVAIVASVLYH